MSVLLPNLVLWLISVVVVVVLIVVGARRGLHHVPGGGGSQSPLNAAVGELDLRYVRGEVEREEYLQRRADLLNHRPPS
jgi:putative membrane protein